MPRSKRKKGDEETEDEPAYTVEKVVDVRVRYGRKEYFLKWKNYPQYVS